MRSRRWAGRLTARRRPLALAALCTLLFLTFLDNTVVSVALASIQSDLHGGVSALQWVVGAYALTFAASCWPSAWSATSSAARRSCWPAPACTAPAPRWPRSRPASGY